MQLTRLLPLIFCTALFANAAVAQQAGSNTSANSDQVRALVLENCQRESAVCECLANSMGQSFSSDKELSIFQAMASNAAEPPADVTDDDLRAFAEKFNAAANACQ